MAPARRTRGRASRWLILVALAVGMATLGTLLLRLLEFSPPLEPLTTTKSPKIINQQPAAKGTFIDRPVSAAPEVQSEAPNPVVPPIPIPSQGKEPPSSAHYANGAANRSPARPPRQINAGSASQVSIGAVRAWSHAGSLTRAPSWVIPLMTQLASSGGLLESMVAAVDDPWQVLVGWVPDRFMGPQKIGKKANGDPMVPPTKGRDIKVYLQEYNSSWHTHFSNGGYHYHFQLLHRNSLAVCIRERLHLYALHLAIDASSKPLLVYHCPCRHCNEHTASIPDGARHLSEAFPSYESPLVRAASAVMTPLDPPKVRRLDAGNYPSPNNNDPLAQNTIDCLPVQAAPWLATLPVVPTFPYEGMYNNLPALLAVRSDPQGVVMMVMFNKFWIDHLHNFIFSMVQRAKFDNYIVATMDSDALAICISARLPCFDAIGFAEFEEDLAIDNGKSKGETRKVTEAMSWIKPRLALAVLERGYHFIMSDLDMSMNFNPIREMVEIGFDIAHQCDAKDKFSINSGFYLARSNPRTIRFFHNLMLFTPQENSDQTAMKLFARYDHTHGASNGCLDRRSFNMKCYYKVAGSVSRENGVEIFEWKDFPRDRSTFTWKLLHATCLNGAIQKMIYLRTMNAWFLDDLDQFTLGTNLIAGHQNAGDMHNNASSYCVVDLEGRRMGQSRTISTLHGPKYEQRTDERYLLKRH